MRRQIGDAPEVEAFPCGRRYLTHGKKDLLFCSLYHTGRMQTDEGM